MLKIQRKLENVYPAVKELIEELKLSGQAKLAETLHHRMYEVPWTTGTELYEELKNIFTEILTSKKIEVSESLKNQMKEIVLTIEKFFQWQKQHSTFVQEVHKKKD